MESYVQKLQMEGTELLSFITFPRSQIQVPLHKLKDHASPGISELANSLIFNKGFGVRVDLTSPNITYPDVHWHLTWHSCKLTKSVVYQTLQFFFNWASEDTNWWWNIMNIGRMSFFNLSKDPGNLKDISNIRETTSQTSNRRCPELNRTISSGLLDCVAA